MEVITINKKTTYFEHEVTIVINHKIIEYLVNSAFSENGKCWIQNYSKKIRGIRLTSSEQRQITKYFYEEFIEDIKMQNPQIKTYGFVQTSSHGSTEF